jgi:hypothetical protein
MHKAVSECGIPTLTDIDHIWAGPEGIWKNKILEHAHRKEISHDLFLLHQTTSDINFDNAFQLFFTRPQVTLTLTMPFNSSYSSGVTGGRTYWLTIYRVRC